MPLRPLLAFGLVAASMAGPCPASAKDTGLDFRQQREDQQHHRHRSQDLQGREGSADFAPAARHAFLRRPHQALRRLRRRRRHRHHRRRQARGGGQAHHRIEPRDLRHRREAPPHLRVERGRLVAVGHRHGPEHHHPRGADRGRAGRRVRRRGRAFRLCDVRGRRPRPSGRRRRRQRGAGRRGGNPPAAIRRDARRQGALGLCRVVGRGLHHQPREIRRRRQDRISCRRACARPT